MHSLLIKICGITRSVLAAQAVKLGVHMIGLVFHKHSRRYIQLNEANIIAKAVKASGAIPVAVFVNETAEEMRAICDDVDIECVQLHGEVAKREHHLLPKHFQRIYVLNGEQASALNEEENLKYCDPDRDFLLFDHHQAGSGKTFDWENFNYHGSFRWFVAGGLNPANVKAAINNLKPNGVDVSSGVENAHGEKELAMIQAFVSATRYD